MARRAKSERDILTGLPFFLGSLRGGAEGGEELVVVLLLEGLAEAGEGGARRRSWSWCLPPQPGVDRGGRGAESASASRGKIYMRSGGTAAATTARDGEPRERRTREEGAAHHNAVCARGNPGAMSPDVVEAGPTRGFGTADGGGAGRRFRASFFIPGGSAVSRARRRRDGARISPGRPRLRKRPMRT